MATFEIAGFVFATYVATNKFIFREYIFSDKATSWMSSATKQTYFSTLKSNITSLLTTSSEHECVFYIWVIASIIFCYVILPWYGSPVIFYPIGWASIFCNISTIPPTWVPQLYEIAISVLEHFAQCLPFYYLYGYFVCVKLGLIFEHFIIFYWQ